MRLRWEEAPELHLVPTVLQTGPPGADTPIGARVPWAERTSDSFQGQHLPASKKQSEAQSRGLLLNACSGQRLFWAWSDWVCVTARAALRLCASGLVSLLLCSETTLAKLPDGGLSFPLCLSP